MSIVTKFASKALDVSGDNYLSWRLDAKLHIQSNKLNDTIKERSVIASEVKMSNVIKLAFKEKLLIMEV